MIKSKAGKSERRRRHRKRFRVLVEIVFMTLGILCSIMPYPFPLVVPIVIGAIRILSKAVEKDSVPSAPPPIVYCNGTQEPHSKARRAVTTPPVTTKPVKGKTASQIAGELKHRSKTSDSKSKVK